MVVTFTRLRAVRRKGVNEHGPVKPSMPDVKSFCGSRQKVFMAVRQQCMDGKTGCACLSPGERTQRGEKTRQGKSRNPPQRRRSGSETALRLTARRQFAGVRKAQVTARKRAAHPERMLQACR
ncbi:hypothetical protein K4X40_25430 [Klebsiella pneumoniae]|uniref:hypothetical protein n=1 Tax=Klebsiella pneumoniae TaxID=573 RepID=UPI001C955CAF|nr:hypothetical protein [Klebsiella pneumoniae]MBY5083890.1 hypothetical protein [Klebsiella pneumoniae]